MRRTPGGLLAAQMALRAIGLPRLGKTFVLIHRGDKAKPEAVARSMESDFHMDWGES